VRSEIFMAVRTMVFWVLAPCRLVGRYQRFEQTYYLHLQGWSGDAGKRMDLCRVGKRESWGSDTFFLNLHFHNPEDHHRHLYLNIRGTVLAFQERFDSIHSVCKFVVLLIKTDTRLYSASMDYTVNSLGPRTCLPAPLMMNVAKTLTLWSYLRFYC
jgi:hypothetical protein